MGIASAYKWLFLSKDKMKESATAANELAKSMSQEQVQEAERRIIVWPKRMSATQLDDKVEATDIRHGVG